jgi:hypothetical protein
MPTNLCGEMAGSNASSAATEAFLAAITRADSATQIQIVRGSVLALVAELGGASALEPSRNAIRGAMAALTGQMSPDEIERLRPALTKGLTSMPPDDACWALVTLYQKMPTVATQSDAAAFLRAMRRQ